MDGVGGSMSKGTIAWLRQKMDGRKKSYFEKISNALRQYLKRAQCFEAISSSARLASSIFHWRGAAAPLSNWRARGNLDFHAGYPTNFFAFFITMVSSCGILRVFPCTDRMHNTKQEPSDDGQLIAHWDLCAEWLVG
jgi:hypothetical protein